MPSKVFVPFSEALLERIRAAVGEDASLGELVPFQLEYLARTPQSAPTDEASKAPAVPLIPIPA